MTMGTAADLVHEKFLARARSQPAAVAVTSGHDQLTYRELADRVVAAAHTLRDAGVQPDEVVGLSCRRTLDGLVGMLGILTAGGAYLYLDPALPAERRRYMTETCDVRVAFTTDGVPQLGCWTIRIEDAGSEGPTTAVGLAGATGPGDLAYIICTSGSTGVPKAVAVEHAGVANMAARLSSALPVTADTRVLQFSAWSWDAAVAEILVPLIAGGTVVLAPDSVRNGGGELAAFIRTQRVNVVTLTPSVLTATPAGGDLPELRTVAAVGETCPPEVVSRWSAPGRRFLNGYGPTEATVAVSVGECVPGEEVHIGTPLPGVRIRIVDESGQPVPTGEAGELLVGGVGIARGYVTGSEPDSRWADGGRFSIDAHGMRWYRSGDLVRRRRDGNLVHLGRLDHQVQVHGHRVELEEIEQALRRHPAVRASAATVRGGRLVAHVESEAPSDAIVAAAREWLPAHMVPDVMTVDRLALTPTGAIDRGKLGQAAGPSVQTLHALGDRPTDDVLSVVLATSRRILETDSVGPHDDFFEIGGHSLLAAELSVALAGHFDIDLPALTVIDHPTAAQLADVVRTASLAATRMV
jgi:amino acid adenylation domain-containing protein